MTRALLVLLALAPLALLPTAVAHDEPRGPVYREWVDADVLFSFDLSTRLALAGTPALLSTSVRSYLDGEHPEGAPLAARLLPPPGRDLAPVELTLTPTAQDGHYEADVRFAEPGAWTLELRSGGAVAPIPVRVYPAPPHVFDWSRNSDLWFHPHRENLLAFVLTDAATGEAIEPPEDMVLHLSRWTDDRATKLSEEQLPLPSTGEPGEFARLQRFAEAGAYEVRLSSASLGLGPDDRPAWPILVTVVEGVDGPVAAAEQREVPVSVATSLLVVLGAALVARARSARR